MTILDYYGTKSNLETHISTVADDGATDQCLSSLFCWISFISKTSNLDLYQLITTLRINLLNIQLMSRIQPPSMWNYKQTIANVHLSLFFTVLAGASLQVILHSELSAVEVVSYMRGQHRPS